MTDPVIPYGRQSIDDEDVAAVVAVLRSDFLTQGPKVGEFEEALAAHCGARFAVAFSSGTAALHGAYFAAGVGPGDEVLTSPITFAATANAALYLGARPVFADVEPDTGNLDPSRIEAALTPRTKVVAPVHFAGLPCDLDAVHDIARRRGLVVVEDACHALGALHRGRPVGALSDLTVFSFHPVKTITTGEGGAVLTEDEGRARSLRLFRSHGITKEPLGSGGEGGWRNDMRILGYNYRMTDLQAALGVSQLRKLDQFISRRRELAARYGELLGENPWFELPAERPYASSAWHLYPIRLRDPWAGRKAGVFDALRARGIGVQCHYIPVYWHPWYRQLGYAPGLCARAEEFSRRELSVPLFPRLSEREQDRVIHALREAVQADAP